MRAPLRSNGPFFVLGTFMVSSVDGNAVRMNSQCDRLNACAVGTCAPIMGVTPTTGGSLSISGLTNGGTYTPGGTYDLSFSGSGERIYYTTAGSLSGDTGCGALSSITTSPTLTAPSSGTMTIVAISSQGFGLTVSYQKITVTAAVAPAAAPPSSPKMPPSPPGTLPTCPPFGTGWTTKVLDASINYVASTKVVGSVFHLRLEALTTGWLGFGFAEPTSGHMKGSDLLTAAVVNGVVRIEDRHALFAPTTYSVAGGHVNGYSGLTAVVDVHADWTVVAGSEENGKTFVWVTRPLVTGDQQDRDIVSGVNRIVWAWDTTDVVAQHTAGGRRGASTMVFFGTEAVGTAFPTTYDGVWTRRFSNYTIPTRITTYACQSFTFPVDASRHIVALRPIGVSQYNHHAILHVCSNNAYHSQATSPQLCSYHPTSNPNPSGGQGSSPLGDPSAGCSGLIWSWAVGMGDFIIPPAAGLRVGPGSTAISHVVLEIHYVSVAKHNCTPSAPQGSEHAHPPLRVVLSMHTLLCALC